MCTVYCMPKEKDRLIEPATSTTFDRGHTTSFLPAIRLEEVCVVCHLCHPRELVRMIVSSCDARYSTASCTSSLSDTCCTKNAGVGQTMRYTLLERRISPSMASRLTAVAFVLLVLLAGAGYLVWSGSVASPFQNLSGTYDSQNSCTKEARVCSDGTIVGRSGPNCSFAECPNDRITDLTPSSTEPIEPSDSTGAGETPPSPGDQMIACTMDAKQCPDGSYVGRSGPNCEFVCPITPINSTVIVHGMVTVGPSCPVMRMPPDDACGDKPFVGSIMLTNTSNGQNYTAYTNESGVFTLTLLRGVYDISNIPGSGPFPSCSGKIEITAPGGPIPISCDSGIR